MNKLIRKIAIFVFAFAVLFAWAPKSYAERFLYTITTASGDTYKLLADVEGENVSIVGSPYTLVTEANTGNIASGSSYYNLITNDYEITYNERDTDTIYSQVQVNERMKNRAKDILRLFQFYINAQETKDDNMSTAVIKFADYNLITGRGATYAYGKIGGSTFDTIIKNVSANVKNNPFAIQPNNNQPIYNSELLKVGDQKLKDYYTDEALIKQYEKSLVKPDWIKKEPSSEAQITSDGYFLQVDKSMMDTTGEIYIKVVDSQSNAECASFLLAEKQRVGKKYKEVTYANDESRKVKWFENNGVKGLTISNSKGINSSNLLYYEMINGQRRTLDRHASGNKLDLEDKTVFVAIRNSDSRSVFVYRIRTIKNVQTVTLLGTVDIDVLGEDLNTGSIEVNAGDWVLDKTGTRIMIYRQNETNPETNCYYVDLDNMYKCYTKQGTYFDVALPVMRGIAGNFDKEFNNVPGSYVAFIISNKSVTKRENTDPMVTFENAYLNNKIQMSIQICQVPEGNTNIGDDFKKKLDVNTLTTNAKSSELPPKLVFKEIIKENDTKAVVSKKTTASAGGSRITGTRSKSNAGIGAESEVTKEDTVSFTEAFLTDTVSIGKNILMILIFCALVAAGFRHALKGAVDPKEREKTKVTLKNILVGILIFITLSLIVTLIWDFTYKGLDMIQGAIEEQAEQEFVNEDEITRGSLLLDIIEVILKVINEIEAGLIEILAKQLTGDATLSVTSTALHEATDQSATTKEVGINYISLIYNVYTPEGAVSSMMPFDAKGVEWSRLLSGYNMLMSVAFVVFIFAIVVTACQYIMFAGNEKKITAVKMRMVRLFWAALLLITVPYLVQFLLYIFNYLTAAIPINWDDPKFEIDINFDGVLGEVARNLFLTTQCNIYMAFLVRHVMISVLLVSGPIVIIAWAIYERFRSFPVWFGELFTNIAMQFCYAVGFMVVIFLSYQGENPVYGLILVSTSMGLSKFIKESLQGYFQEWGGIDEEGTAGSIVKMAFGWANKAKRGIKKTGKILEKASKRVDEDQVTKSGVAASNIGKLMQGKMDFTTKKDRLKNVEGRAKKKATTETDENNNRKNISGNKLEDEQREAQDAFDEYMNDPNVSEEDKEAVQDYLENAENDNVKVIKTGKGFDLANNLARANKNLYRENARKKIRDVNRNFEKEEGDTILNQGIEETTDKAISKHMSQGDKELLELGKQALDIKSEVPPQDVAEKLETTHKATAQLLGQIAAMEDVNDKERAVETCESSIKTLALLDAKANECRMQEDISMLIGKLAEYKAERLQSAGINISEESLQLLEQAMLAKAYQQDSEDED